MTSYIMHDVLKPSAFWKIWWRRPLTSFLGEGGGSDGLDLALHSGYMGSRFNSLVVSDIMGKAFSVTFKKYNPRSRRKPLNNTV